VTAPTISTEHLIVSRTAIQWVLTGLTGGAAAYWIVIDSSRLRRALKDDTTRPTVKDRVFGSIVGLVIGAIGIVGAWLGHP
jgi:hypothetical protein